MSTLRPVAPHLDSRSFEVRSPVTGEVVGEYAAMTGDDARNVVARASDAQREWAHASYLERRAVLSRAADLLESEIDAHIDTLALEVGATRGWAEMNVHESAATLREAAGLTSVPIGELLASADPATVNHSLRLPAGVSLSIVPWNAPVILAARSSAISLAVGNAVIVRPSEAAPASAGHLLADALVRSGLPADVMPVVTTAPGGGRHAINAMIATEAVRRVAFIGSTPVGRAIAAHAGQHLTPSVMELGGKNVTVLRHDVDLDQWAGPVAFSAFANTGQVCMCTDTLLVHASRLTDAVSQLRMIADGMTLGDPRRRSTDLGPLINDAAAQHFSDLIDDARRGGASIVTGGITDGRYAQPTILTDLRPECRFTTEEGFAPILSVVPFDDDDDAVSKANSGDAGLIGAVISQDADAAYRLARRVRAGAIHVNGPSVGDEPHVPFGGLGSSGMGRLGGLESVRFFTEQRTVYVHDQHQRIGRA